MECAYLPLNNCPTTCSEVVYLMRNTATQERGASGILSLVGWLDQVMHYERGHRGNKPPECGYRETPLTLPLD